MSKKITALVLCLILCVSVFAACGTPSQSSGTDDPASSKVESASAPASSTVGTNEEHPNWVTDTPITLKVWTSKPTSVEDFNTNKYIVWLEEQTNVNLEFDQSATVEPEQKLNLSLASGDYPDMYWTAGTGITESNLSKYGSAGTFVPLNDYIEQYGNNVKRWFNEISFLEGASTSPDGNIYGIPNYSGIYHVAYGQKMWINQAWLDNLSLEMPTTLDEFRSVLTAFKEQDANGNGDPNDEIPLTGINEYWHGDFTSYLMCSFIYDDGDKRLNVQNDTVDTIVDKDEYKAGLKYMAQMYKDGLINPESWSSNSEQIKNLTAQNTVGCVSGGHLLGCADLSSDIAQNCETVPPLKGPDGVQTCGYYGNTVVSGTRAIITSACEYPEEAFKLIDFMFSEDASLRARKGEYGVDWGLAEEGEKTCDGREAKYKALSEYTGAGNVEQNQHIDNNGVWAETNDQFMGLWTTPENFDMRDSNYFEQFLFVQTKKYDGFEPEQTLPPIVFTDEENAEVADIEVDVKKYADEQRALFISGQKDIDAEWDAYVQQLENLGLSKMVELYDKAYKRQYVK